MKRPTTPPHDGPSESRRRFLEKLFTATVVGATLPSVLSARLRPAVTLNKSGFSGTYTIDITQIPPLQAVGGAVELTLREIASNFRIVVTRVSLNEFVAVNGRCPHQGNRVKPFQTGLLKCIAHDSLFEPDGTYIEGPATDQFGNGIDLKQYNTSFDGENTVSVEIAELASVAEESGGGDYVAIHSTGPMPGYVVFEASLAKPSSLTLSIWSLDGIEVLRPFEGTKESGKHHIACDLSSLAAGVYLYRLTSASRVIGTGKLSLGG